jgi:hypothetical protein
LVSDIAQAPMQGIRWVSNVKSYHFVVQHLLLAT